MFQHQQNITEDVDRGEGNIEQAEEEGVFDLLASAWHLVCKGVGFVIFCEQLSVAMCCFQRTFCKVFHLMDRALIIESLMPALENIYITCIENTCFCLRRRS